MRVARTNSTRRLRTVTGAVLGACFASCVGGAAWTRAEDQSVGAAVEDPLPAITVEMLDGMAGLPGDLGPLPVVPVPGANSDAHHTLKLGRKLFFEPALSLDRRQSCASCHDPARGFADGRALAVGFAGKQLGRHTPSVLNSAFNSAQFWDGRASTLEEQAVGPITAAAEMNMTSEDELVRRLESVPEYRRDFARAFGSRPSLKSVAQAIAAFERTLVTRDSAFDRYASGDRQALAEDQKKGLILFIGKAGCVACHRGPNFTDNRFHNLGMRPLIPGSEDPGRAAVTRDPRDWGAFKTPSLRNVAQTGPYMHDGSLRTLEEVIAFYERGGDHPEGRSELIFKLNLTAEEKAQLRSFLNSLSGRLPAASVHSLEEVP